MLTYKSHFAKRPFKIKIILKKRNWYLFPQTDTTKKSVAEINYKRDGDVYIHSHFWFYMNWRFLWLFFIIYIEFLEDKEGFAGPTEVVHGKPTYANDKGDLFKA